MSWLAILLSLAAIGGTTTPPKCPAANAVGAAAYTPAAKKACKKQQAAKKKKKKPSKPAKPKPGADKPGTAHPAPRTDAPTSGGAPKPEATPTPTPKPKPGATATPTPTATPVATATPTPLPSRTNVDLTDIREWSVRPSYRALAAGRIDFNVNNRGEDDHNLTVRDASQDLAKIDLAPGETGTLTVQLAAGSYTLYCSLPTHEAAGMKAVIAVR